MFLPYAHLVISIVALMLALGGILGFVKAKSKISLLAGLCSAALLGGAAYLTFNSETTKIGIIIALIVMLILDVMFTYRLGSTKKVMPNLVMIIVLLPAMACLGVVLFKEMG